jgi:hypothetical protein
MKMRSVAPFDPKINHHNMASRERKKTNRATSNALIPQL